MKGSAYYDDHTPLNKLSGNVRVGFIRKVYLILAVQLLITFIFILIAFLSE